MATDMKAIEQASEIIIYGPFKLEANQWHLQIILYMEMRRGVD